MHRKAILHLKRVDPTLARVIERVGPCRFEANNTGSHFEALLKSIVYQQLSGSAAHTIHSRFVALYNGDAVLPERILTTSDEMLRGVGLSRQKIGYIRDLAQRVVNSDVPMTTLHELEDQAVLDALMRVKGIGRWTAQVFLMFRLGRPDVLPELDLGIRKAIQRAYRMRKLPTTERVQKIGATWTPYSTVASWYLWRSLDLEEGQRTPPEKRQGGGVQRRGAKKR